MRVKFDYDLIVIGGGAAGLTSAGIGASFGAKTIMIEADRLGGDCTWTGCIPSKSLLKAAKLVHESKKLHDFGVETDYSKLDFQKVMKQVHHIREEVYHDADRPEIFEAMGIDVVFGRASFKDNRRVEIILNDGGSKTISGKKIIIAGGSKTKIYPIEGLEGSGYLTNETLFELKEQPTKLAILGGGPIGIEMAQAFNRLGTQVHVIEASKTIMPRDHEGLTVILKETLEKEGVTFHTNSKLVKVEGKTGNLKLHVQQNSKNEILEATHLLVATGRQPNTKALGLDKTSIAYTENGITVNKKCQTSVSHIYAAGDITGLPAFTHYAEHTAKIAATNALLKFPQKIDLKHLPWVTFTDPELAHVGATVAELKEKGVNFKTYRFPYTKVDRAAADSNTTGWIYVYAKPFSGKILGADVLGVSAGEVISEYALAMKNGLSLKKIADTIHPYPTYGLGARRAADQWYIQSQKPWMIKLIQKVFGYRGKIQEIDENTII